MDSRGSGTGFSSILDDFGTYFESFWAPRLEISIFVGLVSRSLFVPILTRSLDAWGS